VAVKVAIIYYSATEHLKDELLNRNWLPRGDLLNKRAPFCYDLLA